MIEDVVKNVKPFALPESNPHSFGFWDAGILSNFDRIKFLPEQIQSHFIPEELHKLLEGGCTEERSKFYPTEEEAVRRLADAVRCYKETHRE